MAGERRFRAREPENSHVVSEPHGVRLRSSLPGGEERFVKIAWSPDGRMLAASCRDGSIYTWDSAEGHLSRSIIRVHSNKAPTFSWLPNGKELFSISEGKTIQLWDARTSGLVDTWDMDEPAGLTAWSTDGRAIAGSKPGAVFVWDASGKERRRFSTSYETTGTHNHWTYDWTSETVTSLAWDPDSHLIAAGTDGGFITC